MSPTTINDARATRPASEPECNIHAITKQSLNSVFYKRKFKQVFHRNAVTSTLVFHWCATTTTSWLTAFIPERKPLESDVIFRGDGCEVDLLCNLGRDPELSEVIVTSEGVP